MCDLKVSQNIRVLQRKSRRFMPIGSSPEIAASIEKSVINEAGSSDLGNREPTIRLHETICSTEDRGFDMRQKEYY